MCLPLFSLFARCFNAGQDDPDGSGTGTHSRLSTSHTTAEPPPPPKPASYTRISTLAKPRRKKQLVKPTAKQPLSLLGFNTSGRREPVTVAVDVEEVKNTGSAWLLWCALPSVHSCVCPATCPAPLCLVVSLSRAPPLPGCLHGRVRLMTRVLHC
jgi:hypothetical protein